MKKKRVFAVLLIMLVMSNIGVVNAATVFRQCSQSQSRYSWTGLRCYTMNVFGNYRVDTSAKKIVSYEDTHFSANCSLLWDYYGEYSYWGAKDDTGAACVGGGNFVLGVVLKENYFGVQHNDDRTVAYALSGK